MHKTTHLLLIIGLMMAGVNQAQAQIDPIEKYYHRLEKLSKKDTAMAIQFVQKEMDLVANYENVYQIILLRHGEPALNKKGWRKRKEAIKYVKAYDSVGVYEPIFNPVILKDQEIDVLFTSTLNRSISTAHQVFNRPNDQMAKPIFREFERKVFGFPNIKLPLKWWMAISRSLWFMGLNKKGIEHFSDAKKRARNAAIVLENNSKENGKTLLVSHGLLNHFLVKYLEKNGWTEVFDGGKGYLSQKLMVKIE